MTNAAGEADYKSFEYDENALFGHIDETAALDARADAQKEIAEIMHAAGPVIRGKGLRLPSGSSAVEFAGVVFPNVMTPADFVEEQDPVFVIGWDAVRKVYLNPAVYSSTVFETTVGVLWGPALSPMDPPEHTKYREIMQRGFTPKRIKSYEDAIIRPIIKARFDDIKHKGKADLARDLNVLFPFQVVGGIVGFDPSMFKFVGACFARMWQANTDPQGAFEASQALKSYSKSLIESRRGKPPESDLVSAMMEATVDGAPLSEERFVAMLNHFMAGGIDTTFSQSSILAHTLLNWPDQFELLKRDRLLIPQAVEECLRFDGVGNFVCRRAIQDSELEGVPIPKGTVVFMMHGLMNRDRSRWENPHVFDIQRPKQAHSQFGSGPHSCIGQHLARFMLARYTEHLIDDLPNLRWDPALTEIPKVTGWTQRRPLTLPVVWDVEN